jgi:prepilin-type N-terminal cleavage/methylation domain-containing protein
MPRASGFSLIELMLAMTITVGISAAAFQLFQQNSRVFQDQDLIIDAQQMARAAVSEITDEIRMAGQGVPIFSATDSGGFTDGVNVIMEGSSSARLNLRSGRSNVEAIVTGPPSLTLTAGVAASLTITDAGAFSSLIGSAPAGRFAYVWGPAGRGWGWARASIGSIAARTNTILLTPVEIGGAGGSIQFSGAPTIELEEAVAIFWDTSARSIRRATATDMSNPAAPGWSPANDMAINVSRLSFTYYDREGNAIEPDSLEHRASIARIDFELGIEVERPLSTGVKPEYRFESRVTPRNLKIR